MCQIRLTERESYEDLANAVVEQAVDDYVTEYRWFRKKLKVDPLKTDISKLIHINSKAEMKHYKAFCDARNFLTSDEIEMYTLLDKHTMFEKINENIEELIKKKDSYNKSQKKQSV